MIRNSDLSPEEMSSKQMIKYFGSDLENTQSSISIIFTLPFFGACFVFVFALRMKSKMIFGILATYTMISLGNTLFRMFVGLNDGDWFERCFGESIDTFHSVITILHSIFQVFISFILVRMSFWEMDASCCCCHCCIICCCCCPCFEKVNDDEWNERSEKISSLTE
ncbi:hypothetical protein B9Z55_002291 [Caenorhabditis nigoni]|uniref:Uncharacterized protein n=2 Tax=Caenorhabditis nigoni TaxID=1611254 RepID=A0A2G5VJT5_9PELO|nr:hypothetical protein B9Z55_002291 [Caenorhabditis nigoni]